VGRPAVSFEGDGMGKRKTKKTVPKDGSRDIRVLSKGKKQAHPRRNEKRFFPRSRRGGNTRSNASGVFGKGVSGRRHLGNRGWDEEKSGRFTASGPNIDAAMTEDKKKKMRTGSRKRNGVNRLEKRGDKGRKKKEEILGERRKKYGN